ncbi:NYN domain-containing protein [Savagea sp. SN6]|uniref:NYN domain-containing protein n=1 Tax=Savagea serpentis TaxID=2785297 RepID=A0A8J7GC61_9BACL|nr:NYN domain-containing protein [Savagea serpentis]
MTRRKKKRDTVLIVDGYNIIGDWPELQKLKLMSLDLARRELEERLEEYAAYMKWRIILVFDAHLQKGQETVQKGANIQTVYTRENETADERIEKLVQELKRRQTTIYVATSDSVEQWVIFGQGALRKSARELQLELGQSKEEISGVLHRPQKREKAFENDRYPPEVMAELEKIRRGLK